uniref:Uncharacterized protein n=1 Tax=Rhizobium rhizogenes TaxID=359 RepID=A0A7S4ZSM3_RHIRH|nr:hypothetical protein pC6.5b_423 [Rhizobium rhizogenes]QCL10472.1 hypothetical protein pC6.5c_579 [Rhizobium rhizogenes]
MHSISGVWTAKAVTTRPHMREVNRKIKRYPSVLYREWWLGRY